jgi:signal transduction histidine kinase
MLREGTLSSARSLATDLERPMLTGDMFSVKQKLLGTSGMVPQVDYIVVRDREGRVAAHTFKKAVPTDLEKVFSESVWGTIQVLTTGDGLILDSTVPILDGHAGSVQLGMSDRLILRELSQFTRSILEGLVLCISVGAVLALGLTHILTQPIHHLVQVAKNIEDGDFKSKARMFSGDEIGVLAVAVNQMTDSLDKYRLEVEDKERARLSLIEKIIQTQEEERRSISRELHDQLGQALLALLLMVQSCGEGEKLAPETLSHMEQKITALIDEIHCLVQGMRPPILDDYGLDSALTRLVKELTEYAGVSIDYQYTCPPGSGRLPSRVEVTLYRIAQEAITNVVRHAKADRASVVLLQQHDDVVLLIEDDGCGFDPTAVRVEGGAHLGIMGMKERATLLGGSCTVESAPGNSTTVRIRIPINEEVE